jgi:DNA polymerase III subunit epsilon
MIYVDDDEKPETIEEANERDTTIGLSTTIVEPFRNATAREKLRIFLQAHPAGADTSELMGLLFKGVGSDPELGARLIHGLIGHDPNFFFDSQTGLWSPHESTGLRVPLDEASFVVVDLETTGGRPTPGSIIEIGAYRMHGRRITSSFQSLVRPRLGIPRFVMKLTSITNEMVAAAPPIEKVLPEFRAFLGDSVMVAHNAQFDRAFLDFEFRRLFGIGLTNPILCTVQMARKLMPSLKRRRLDLLAEHFGLSTEGRHRGLGDARMASEILSIFLEIAMQMGLKRLDRLLDHHARGSAGRRVERHVAPEVIAALPRSPGVYLMRNHSGDLLYVGKATRLKDRVGSYFNGAANLKAKTAELISHVWSIETLTARSALEAAFTEARLIRQCKPPYNRMLKSAAPAFFLRIDLMDPYPRLQLTRKLSTRNGMLQLGPFIGRRNLDHSIRALARILGLRVCSGRLQPHQDFSPCVYGQMGHCAAPCNLGVSDEAYGERVRRAVSFLRGRSGALLGELAQARDHAAASMRFEEAHRLHRDLEALATLTERATRLSRVVTENNLLIVLPAVAPAVDSTAGGAYETGSLQGSVDRESHDKEPTSATHDRVYVILSGRVALVRDLDSPTAAPEIAGFVAANYERYRARPVTREELEPMTIVGRWLRERSSDDGRLIHLHGPTIEPAALMPERTEM